MIPGLSKSKNFLEDSDSNRRKNCLPRPDMAPGFRSALAPLLTLHRDLAKFFFSCSETVPWMFLLLASSPEILEETKGVEP